MNKHLIKILIIISFIALSGCKEKPLTEEQKQEYENDILNCYVQQGPDGAQNYVDMLIAEGKINIEKGKTIKNSIPKGIEHLKKTLKEKK